MDPEAVERVEAELDAFVEKRVRQAKDAQRVQKLWAESERKERNKHRQRNGWAWVSFYESLARAHWRLAHEHEDKAAHVRELLGEHGLITEHKVIEVSINERNGHAGKTLL